jgi:ABC-type oligopeptide transport system ATPase subunit
MNQLLELNNVNKSFKVRGSDVQACRDIHLSVQQGEVVGLVGESGSGKSTLANLTLGLEEMDSGEISFQGRDIRDFLSKDPKLLEGMSKSFSSTRCCRWTLVRLLSG